MQTPEQEYALIFQGQVAEGQDVAEVKTRLTALMRCDPKKTEEFFSGRKLIFKRCADQETAEQAADRLRRIGMVIEIHAVARKATPQPTPPPQPAPPPTPAAPDTPSVPAEPPPPAPKADTDAQAAPAPPKPAIPERRPAAQPVAKERRVPFVFNGDGGEFFKIWIVNVLLTILTLGIYSAWAKVRTLRYFYGNSSLDGSAFEYLAEPIKILKGRLIVFGFFLVVFITTHFYPHLNPLFGLLLVLLTPWIVRQSLRFRCHYTAWRGVRFAFGGSLWDAAKAFVVWPFLPFAVVSAVIFLVIFVFHGMISSPGSSITTIVLLCLFSLLPLFTVPISWHRQTHYLVDNSRYGAAGFVNHSEVGEFRKVLGSLIVWSILMGILVTIFASILKGGFTVGMPTPRPGTKPGAIDFVLLAMMAVFYTPLISLYKVKITNLRFGKTAIGPHRLVSSYEFGSYLALTITNTLAVILTLGLFYPFAKVRTARYAAEHTAMAIRGDLDSFVAGQQAEVSAVGGEAGEFFDIDIGF